MSVTRIRLVALTCAAAVALTPAGFTSADAVSAAAPESSTAALRTTHVGLDRLLTGGAPTGRAIVTFDAVPTAADTTALRALGLTVEPLNRLPMALVAGPEPAMVAAVTSGIGNDIYPDEELDYYDTASSNVMSSSPRAAKQLRARGLTGKGITVGVVDSGCDGTHPDLAKRIVNNVILFSPEYVNAGTSPMVPVPIDMGPYNNTDIGSGHGSHVGGIIAADGSSGKPFMGVAPDAKLACFAIGAVITTTAVVTAYDYMLDQPKMLGIDVINNSWGNSFRQYDPKDPVNVATKAVTAKGAVVVFAAGNSGGENGEASVSPFNQAPWVISVAAGTVTRERGDFSSNGLQFDNGKHVAVGAGGHNVFTGDRVGVTQPDMMAPGVDISSSCASTGSVIGPCPDHGNAEASGTSMASPHVAGAAAVVMQANRRLTPAQVQKALKATASPVLVSGKRLSYSQVGYGHVNLDLAVKLVRRDDYKSALTAATRRANGRLMSQDQWAVTRSDTWQEAAPFVSLGGSYTATHKVTVARGVSALKVALVYPTPGILANLASFTATITNRSGKVVGTTKTNLLYATGIANTLIRGIKPGEYTIEVVGEYAASDPDTIDSDSINGRVVFLQAAQLKKR